MYEFIPRGHYNWTEKKMFSASQKYVFHIGRKQEPNMD